MCVCVFAPTVSTNLHPPPPPPPTEMNYNAATEDEPAGEVLLRGPQLFSGYYKQVRKEQRVCGAQGQGGF